MASNVRCSRARGELLVFAVALLVCVSGMSARALQAVAASASYATSTVVAGKRLTIPLGSSGVCNPLTYGAKGDGVTNDTLAVQAALDACQGTPGAVVFLPAGYTFLTSAVSVHPLGPFGIQIAGTLAFTNDTASWPATQPPCLLIQGGASVALFGGGTVDGRGAAWWPNPDAFRPDLLQAHDTNGLLITNLTFINSPYHNLELYANDMELAGVTVLAPPSPIALNTDAVDVHGSPAFIHDCYFSVGDDNLALHANDTLAENNVFGNGHGASIGSLAGAVALRNITVRDTVFYNTTWGARIKTDGGARGYLTDVLYTNLTMYDVGTTILVTMYYENCTSPCNTTLSINNVAFANITSFNAGTAGAVLCMPEAPCTGIRVSNVVQPFNPGVAPPSAWACQSAFGAQSGNDPALPCLSANAMLTR